MNPPAHRFPTGFCPRFVANWLVIAMVLTSTGCTLCQDCGDLDYPTYGGAWERTRRDSGRVGSLFDPAGVRTAALVDRDSQPDDLKMQESNKEGVGPNQNQPGKTESEADNREDGDRDRSPSDRDRKGSKVSGEGSLKELGL